MHWGSRWGRVGRTGGEARRRASGLGAAAAVAICASLAFAAMAGATSARSSTAPARAHVSGARLFEVTRHPGSQPVPRAGKSGRSPFDIIFPTENQLFSGQVGTFTEPCVPIIFFDFCFPPAASVDWGDGSSDPNPTITPLNCVVGVNSGTPSCTFAVSSSHAYAEEGAYTTVISWSVSNPGVGGATLGTAFVQDQPLSAGTGPTVTGIEGTVVSAVGSFTDANTSAPLSDFSVTINWGDGSTSPGTVSGGAGSYQVSGTHIYDESPGAPYAISMGVSDVGGASVSTNGTASIHDAALGAGTATVNATEGPFSGTVATFTDNNTSAPASDFTATIHWGDGSAPTIGTVTGSGGTFTVSGTHTYEEGTFTPFTVNVADEGGNSTSMSGTAHVTDAALTGTAQSISAFATVPYSGVVATFKDANPAATVTNYTATVNWGDGTTGPGVVVANPSGGWQVSGSHTFASPGTLPVKVTIDDAGGSTATVNDTAAVGSPPVPVTSFTPSPGSPNGNNGWYRTPVNVIITASGLGTTVAQTRCVLDPAAAPASFDALPGSCPFTGSGANVTGDGVHRIYAASVNVSGNKESPVLSTLKIDSTPPALACAGVPTFVLGSSGGLVTATVHDATSGPASSTVSAPAQLSSPGIHSVALTGFDNAGNAASVKCSYKVLGHMNNLMNWGFVPGPKFATVADLVALDVPIGSQIKVVCSHARGCPFKSKSKTVSLGAKCKGKHCSHKPRPHTVNVDLTGMFGKHHVPVGSQLLIEISKQFEIGKVFILTIRRDQQPSSTVTCLAPGSTKPGVGC